MVNANPSDAGDSRKVEEIAEAVGPCPWVCSVRVFGHSSEWSCQKGVLAARIAFAAISLAWNTPSNQAQQTGLIYDIGPYRVRHSAMFNQDLFVGGGWEKVLRIGRSMRVENSIDFIANSETRLRTVGTALNTFLSTNPTGPTRLLDEALCHALIWFGEACNESLDFVAIVKFAAALDTLAKGKRAKGICDLVERRFPVHDMDAPFLSDGTSARKLVEQIYDTGRSQIVHGTHPRLLDDLEQLRAWAEFLSSLVLRACITWLEGYTGPDDVDAFRTSA